VVLGSIFIVALGLGAASKIALAVVMVFFVVFGERVPGRARSRQEPDRERAVFSAPATGR